MGENLSCPPAFRETSTERPGTQADVSSSERESPSESGSELLSEECSSPLEDDSAAEELLSAFEDDAAEELLSALEEDAAEELLSALEEDAAEELLSALEEDAAEELLSASSSGSS